MEFALSYCYPRQSTGTSLRHFLCNPISQSTHSSGSIKHKEQHRCNGVAEIASSMTMNWRPALDEVLLMSSVLLAYVAGIVTPPTPNFSKREESKGVNQLHSMTGMIFSSEWAGDVMWDAIHSKLADALSRFKKNNSANERVASHSLYLGALAYGPKLRLFMTALMLLRNEVAGIRKTKAPLQPEVSCIEIFRSLVGTTCRTWLSKEELLRKGRDSNMLIKNEAFWEDDATSYLARYIERSGKLEIYSDILFFLCYNASRSNGFCDTETCTKLADSVTEDMVVAISEGAAAMYLSYFGNSISSWPGLLNPSILSTRSLVRIRNEVALQQWLDENFSSVSAIYEDRVELWTLKARRSVYQNNPKKKGTEKQDGLDLCRKSIRWRRSEQLKCLSGWRYYYSLYLEFSDIVGPLLRRLMTSVEKGLSFLLVCLIGRSFGLIYKGIRRSVKRSPD